MSEISVLLRARQGATYDELATAVNDPKTMTKEEQIQFAEELLSVRVPKDINNESEWQEWALKTTKQLHVKKAHEIILI